ncbi:MAG: hypothetical protein AB1726_00935 [Planctomycetota bacterium]
MNPHHNRRKKTFVMPEVQRSWALLLLFATATSLVAQAVLLMFLLTRLATTLPNDGDLVLANIQRTLFLALGLTFAFLAPFLVLVGVMVSFRVAGPLHRFESFLRQVIAGERPPDCRLRKGDQLGELCALLNRATAPLRQVDFADTEHREAA